MADVEQAFTEFHNSQCTRFGIAHSAADFKSALKELDGTFVAIRTIQESLLVCFQNPSIRDFMQNLLLGGELLPELIDSLVFFEQAHWFAKTLNDEKPRFSLKVLKHHASKLVDAAQSLIEANSCSFEITGTQPWQHIATKTANPAERLATIALAVVDQHDRDDGVWMASKLSELATKVEAGKLSPSCFVGPIETLENLGYLTSEAGKHLFLVLKCCVLTELSELDDFETLAYLVNALPQSFVESELEIVRETYSEFAEQYPDDCGLSDPEEYREEASRIGNIGDLLNVDTGYVQDRLRESANEIEEERASQWDGDDDRRGNSSFDMCSNGELDSMFGTLAS